MADPLSLEETARASIRHTKTVDSLVEPIDWSLPHDADCPGCAVLALLSEVTAQRAEITRLQGVASQISEEERLRAAENCPGGHGEQCCGFPAECLAAGDES